MIVSVCRAYDLRMNPLKSWWVRDVFGLGFFEENKKKRAGGLFLLHSQRGSFFLVSHNHTLFNEVIAVPLSHIPSWVQHLEKLKNSMNQIILLKLLFIAGHFVLSSPWQNVKALLSVAFSSQHLQGSDMPPLHYTGGNRQTVVIKAASPPAAGAGTFRSCIAAVPSVRDQISPSSLSQPFWWVSYPGDGLFWPIFSLLLKFSKVWRHETLWLPLQGLYRYYCLSLSTYRFTQWFPLDDINFFTHVNKATENLWGGKNSVTGFSVLKCSGLLYCHILSFSFFSTDINWNVSSATQSSTSSWDPALAQFLCCCSFNLMKNTMSVYI